MDPLRIARKTLVEQVYDRLYELTTGPDMQVGDRLQSVRKLAERFGTSVPTVLKALDRLEGEGLVERRPGSGVYVDTPAVQADATTSSVVLCMDVEASQELLPALLPEIQKRGHSTIIIDGSDPDVTALLRARSQSTDCLVIQGGVRFPFSDLTSPEFRRKPMIGAVDWDTDLEIPGLAGVVSDSAVGGRLVSDHLRDLGHKHVLIVGPAVEIDAMNSEQGRLTELQRSFTERWSQSGGTWEALGSDANGSLGGAALVEIFSHPEPPTAIFGLRDREANQAQRILADQLPRLADQVAIVGYGDTAWSRASWPAITTVNLDFEKLAGEISTAVNRALAGKKGRAVRVRPALVERETSVRRGPG